MNPLPAADARIVVGYVRTSSAEQGKAFGPDAQRAAIRAFAQREGLTIAAVVHEDISGTVPAEDRSGLTDAITAAYQHGASALLIAERSRLARDEYVAFDAERYVAASGLRALYAHGSNGDDDAARLAAGFEHLIAAHDRRRIVARLKAGRDVKAERFPHARAQGGRLAHGYMRDRNGMVVIDPNSAAEVRRVFDLVRSGQSIRKTAATMSAETGREWRPNVVDKIVRREDYKLKRPDFIVSPQVWNATQASLASRRRSPGRRVA